VSLCPAFAWISPCFNFRSSCLRSCGMPCVVSHTVLEQFLLLSGDQQFWRGEEIQGSTKTVLDFK
jgi:hypothetical protein